MVPHRKRILTNNEGGDPHQRNLSNSWIYEIKINKFVNTNHFQAEALVNQKQRLSFVLFSSIIPSEISFISGWLIKLIIQIIEVFTHD